jgi:hypothetical protein
MRQHIVKRCVSLGKKIREIGRCQVPVSHNRGLSTRYLIIRDFPLYLPLFSDIGLLKKLRNVEINQFFIKICAV